MERKHLDTESATSVTVQIAPEVNRKLEGLARDLKRSKSQLAGEALTSFVERNASQIQEIKRALKDTTSVPHSWVAEWVRSWRAGRELRRPQPEA
jgi:predicted transcriptional regulator